jgi:hypothetical protein
MPKQTSQTSPTPTIYESLQGLNKLLKNTSRGGKRVLKRLKEIEERLTQIIQEEKSTNG